jgi:predicted regulator of Ras-like GTPase activity (Roadblock/LC7/MglB family)
MAQSTGTHLHLATDAGQRLRGQISDLGIVQLVQIPHSGRRTGELNIFPGEDEARRANRGRLTDDGLLDDEAKLFYVDGELVHAAFADVHGFDAVVEVLSWRNGHFEFRDGVRTEVCTIDGGLHTILVQALKRCDKAEEENGSSAPSLPNQQVIQEHLDALVTSDGPVFFAAVVTTAGQPVATASQWTGAEDTVAALRFGLCMLLATQQQRRRIRRIVVEDEEIGTAVLCRIPQGFLVAVASEQTQIGAVSVTVSRTAQAIANETHEGSGT